MKVGFLSLVVIFIGCSDKKIEITAEYIINENWSKRNDDGGGNSITINRMKVKKDGVMSPVSSIDQTEVLRKLEEDSSFMHYTNVKIKESESYKNKKIYFNKDNGFYWGSKSRYHSDDTTKTIGILQPGNWYKFSHLVSFPYYIYIFIDSTGRAYRFDVNPANY